MPVLILALVLVVVVNAALAVYLAKRGRRKDLEHEQSLAREAGEKALRDGFVRVRGESWTRSHLPR